MIIRLYGFIKSYLVYVIISFSIFALIYNIIHYDPVQGYDAEAHYNYLYFLSMYLPQNFVLPTIENTREFFNPPLPYMFPAMAQVVCRNIISSADYISDCKLFVGTTTQIFQTILYLLTLLFYLKSFKLLKNNNSLLNINLILMISLLSVNYRTISMIRGEPYILLFNSILIYLLISLIKKDLNYKWSDIYLFGSLIGLMALSRQWAFLLMPGYFLIVKYFKNSSTKKYLKFISMAFIFGFFVSSWFYFILFFEYGSFTAFNMDPKKFSLFNQPLNFYNPFNNEVSLIFSQPIRPNFSNQFFPILYSDLWGDYWGYFVFVSRNLAEGRGQILIGDYLGRVNIISLIPTFIFIVSLYSYKKLKGSRAFHSYILISSLVSFFGFLWFLIKYPELPSGDTIKSSYIIQLFHLVAIISASYLEDLQKKDIKKYSILILMLAFCYFHNFSAYLSHFAIKF
tara:strand:- start:2514 stop:3878 length:1365 start_codon:yes stop_codon:yes gene_type:complete